jgi:hypothetical protein
MSGGGGGGGGDSSAFPDLEVATTLSEVATQIQRESYAIYRVDDDTHQAVQEAWREAREFFSSVRQHNGDDGNEQVLERRKTIMDSYRVIQNGHLMGFHVPSAAKYLFRAHCCDDKQEGVGKQVQQPWPSESFRSASCRLAGKLDEILNQCCSEIRSSQTNKAGSKRKWDSNSNSNDDDDDDDNNNIVISSRPEHCPLDYFLYHGGGIDVAPASIVSNNCTAHVDRGYLIAICLTNNSPGLEVLPATATTTTAAASAGGTTSRDDDADGYVCPEAATQRASLFAEAAPCTNLICILAGDQWRQLDPETTVKACVHRVRNNLRASRLSISYELRI